MNSELEILKTIWENGGKSSVRLISRQTRFGIDYVRYICNCLFKKGQIEVVEGKRDWYRIASKGNRELRLRQLIEPKVFLSVRAEGGKVANKGLKGLIKPKEKTLNLGKSIAKAVSLLKRSKKEG